MVYSAYGGEGSPVDRHTAAPLVLLLGQLHPGQVVLSDLDQDEDVEDGGEEEGQDGPEQSHPDHHLALQPLSSEPPGVGQEGGQDPDRQAAGQDDPDWERAGPRHPEVPQWPHYGQEPLHGHQEDVEDHAHLEDVGQVLQVPVGGVDVGDHRPVLEHQDLDVEPAEAQQQVGQGQAGDADVGGGVEVGVQGGDQDHRDVGEDDQDQQEGLEDEVAEGDVEDSWRNTTLSCPGSPTHTRLVGSSNTGTGITLIFALSLLKYFYYNITEIFST